MPQMSIQDAIELAKRAHQGGNLAGAEEIYRQVLAVVPEHPEALHLLGLVELQSGRLEGAVGLIRRAIAADPMAAHFHANLGLALMVLKRPEEAVAAYERALLIHAFLEDALAGIARDDVRGMVRTAVGKALEKLA